MNQEIMIIDDSEDQVELLKIIYRSINPQIHIASASSGVEALKYLLSKSNKLPKVILLDLNLPKQDGHEILEILKNNEELKGIPICIFSASDLQSDICKSYRLGASFFFKKPTGLQQTKEFIKSFHSIWFTFAQFCEHHI